MDTIELSAYHESGRVVMAYQCGFTCDGIELSETDSGNGKSKLNGGQDLPYVQAILSGKTAAILQANPDKAVGIARKLMKIYCAGSCAEIFHENNKQLSSETEMEIPGQDLRNIELIQQFLAKQDPGHAEDHLQVTMSHLFKEMTKEETWKPIEALAKQLLKSDGTPFTRFNIEDALMLGGYKVQKQKQEGHSFGFNIKEDTSPSRELAAPYTANDARLDNSLKEFFMMIKQDWSEAELNTSIQYLKKLFDKYKNS